MTEFDEEIPGLASELLAEFGKDIIYTERKPGNYNPATSGATPTGAPPLTIKGIVEPYRGQRMLAGLVEINDLKVTCAASDFGDINPTPDDYMKIDDDNYIIISVLPTYSGELKAIYEFQVRQS